MHREIHCSFAAWKRKTCFFVCSLSTPFVRLTKPPPHTFLVGTCRRSSANGHLNTKGSMVFRRRIFTLSSCTARHGACIAVVNCNLAKLMNFAFSGRVKLLRIWDKLFESSNSPMKRCEKFGFFKSGNPPLPWPITKRSRRLWCQAGHANRQIQTWLQLKSTKKHHVFLQKDHFSVWAEVGTKWRPVSNLHWAHYLASPHEELKGT